MASGGFLDDGYRRVDGGGRAFRQQNTYEGSTQRGLHFRKSLGGLHVDDDFALAPLGPDGPEPAPGCALLDPHPGFGKIHINSHIGLQVTAAISRSPRSFPYWDTEAARAPG